MAILTLEKGDVTREQTSSPINKQTLYILSIKYSDSFLTLSFNHFTFSSLKKRFFKFIIFKEIQLITEIFTMAQNDPNQAPLTTDPNYGAHPTTGDSAFEGHNNSGIAGSAMNYDARDTGNTGSYGNTHSTTGRSNPIHPSDPQSTAHPTYGKHGQYSDYKETGYETGGANPGQGVAENSAGTGSTGGGGGGGRFGTKEYHENVDAAYGHATGPHAPKSQDTKPGPYEVGGGNPGEGKFDDSGPTGAGMGTTGTTGTTGEMSDNRSRGAKVKEGASGVKGMVAAVHGVGEKIRGEFNSGVDRAFNEVCVDPPTNIFPTLKTVNRFAELDFPPEKEMDSTDAGTRAKGVRKEEGRGKGNEGWKSHVFWV